MHRTFECADTQHNSLTPNRELNTLYVDHLSTPSHTGVINFKNGPVFWYNLYLLKSFCVSRTGLEFEIFVGVVPRPPLLIPALPSFLPLSFITPTSSWRSPINSAMGSILLHFESKSTHSRITDLLQFNLCFNFVISDPVPSFSLGGPLRSNRDSCCRPIFRNHLAVAMRE